MPADKDPKEEVPVLFDDMPIDQVHISNSTNQFNNHQCRLHGFHGVFTILEKSRVSLILYLATKTKSEYIFLLSALFAKFTLNFR